MVSVVLTYFLTDFESSAMRKALVSLRIVIDSFGLTMKLE